MPKLTRRFLLLTPAIVLLAACSSAPAERPTASPGASDGTSANRIEVRLRDSFRIEPGDFTVPSGEPVTFVVKNAGVLDHEFYVGDATAQEEHNKEMLSGGMGHDDPNGVSLKAGETKELTITFEEPGPTLAGCHVPGHYAGGMKTTITVTE